MVYAALLKGPGGGLGKNREEKVRIAFTLQRFGGYRPKLAKSVILFAKKVCAEN